MRAIVKWFENKVFAGTEEEANRISGRDSFVCDADPAPFRREKYLSSQQNSHIREQRT